MCGPAAVRARVVSRFEGDLVGRSVGGDPSAPEGPPSAFATASSMETAAPPRPIGAAASTSSDGAGDRAIGHRDGARRYTMGRDRAVPPSRPCRRRRPTRRGRSEPTIRPAGRAMTRLAGRAAPRARRSSRSRSVGPIRLRSARPADGRAAPGRRSPTAVPSEPDVVHVHIGRVEVRAIVPAPEPSRPAPRPARPAPLSLDRYLSGERRT